MKARRPSPLGFMFLALGAPACSSGASESLSPVNVRDGGGVDAGEVVVPCGSSTLAAGTFSLSFGGVDYGYVVHLPPGYDGTKRTPLVLNWHGLTSNAQQQQLFSAFDVVADEEGVIVVYPNSPDASWNGGTCCASASARDDVGFARALVAEVSSRACIDSKRVYSTGMSNGGFMSFRLGCEAADLFAAIAPVAGKIGVADCRPARPIPLLAIHGTADTLVPFATGGLSAGMLTVPDTAQQWADLDACTQGPDRVLERGNVHCEAWSGCGGGATVTLCTVEGGGHCWPGQNFCPYGTSTVDLDASRQIAAFFESFKLP
jgi:polyhydroxybutyrate depolymerase